MSPPIHPQNSLLRLGEFKKLSKDTLIYGLGNAANRMVSFFLIPIYTAYLATWEYGIRSLTTSLEQFLFPFATLGFVQALIADYYATEAIEERRRVVSTAFLSVTIMGFIIGLSMFLFSGGLSKLLFQREFKDIMVLFSIYFAFNLPSLIFYSFLRARVQPRLYAFFTFSKSIIRILLISLFLILLKKGLKGAYISDALVMMIYFPFILFLILKYTKGLKFSKKWWISMLKYGLPLVPATIFHWLRTFSDRFLISYLIGLGSVGIFSVAVQFSSVVSFILIAPLSMAWLPYAFSIKDREDKGRYYSRALTYYLFVGMILWLVVSGISREFIPLIAKNPSYWQASQYIPILTFGILLYGAGYILATPINVFRKTIYISLGTLFSGIANISCNFLLLPKIGIMGATLASLICYLTVCLFFYFIAQRIYPIRYERRRIAMVAIIGILLYLILSSILLKTIWLSLLLKIVLSISLFPLILYLLGFFTKDEKRIILHYIKRW